MTCSSAWRSPWPWGTWWVGNCRGGTSARHPREERSRPGLGWQLSSLSPCGAVARAVPRPAQAFAQLCRGAGGGTGQGVSREPAQSFCARLPFKSRVLKYARRAARQDFGAARDQSSVFLAAARLRPCSVWVAQCCPQQPWATSAWSSRGTPVCARWVARGAAQVLLHGCSVAL